MEIEFKYPFLFVLLIPALFIIYLYLKQAKESRNVERYTISILRSLIFGLLIFTLAVPQILLPLKAESVVFLIDRSASVEGSEEKALDIIEESLKAKKKHQSYAVVSFAKGSEVEASLATSSEGLKSLNGSVDRSESNLEGAIQFAGSLLPTGESGRMVMLSDGNETTGDALEAVKILKARGVEFDYLTIKNSSRNEMALTDFGVEPSLFQGEDAELGVTIDSNTEGKATVRISVNNKDWLTKEVKVLAGRNEYSFSHRADEPGMLVYKAEIATDTDQFVENNTLYGVSNVKGTPRVLVVDSEQPSRLQTILQSSGLLVDSLIPEKLPQSLSGFLHYQSIIFNNVAATSISQIQMEMIETAVKDFGTGFVMTGGDQSFGLGGYFKTPIEKLLPVDMDIKGKKQMPSLGLVIVLDRSGSMGGNKIELAKEAAARSVELLRDEDTLGFIAFDDRPWVLSEAKPLKDKKAILKKIRSIAPGGGTEIYSSLEAAYGQLENLKLQRKHIILLTDGQSAPGDYESLIAGGKGKNITLSTVALGSDADRSLLEDLATQGSGRFYDVTDASVIPSVLSRETVMATRTYIEDHPFYPEVNPSSDWTGIFQNGVPKMNAYIATTVKPRAQLALTSEKKDPVLAEWQYGLGTTLAFTSDVSGKWAGDFALWEKWPQFLAQLATKSLPKYDSDPFGISVDSANGQTNVSMKTSKDKFLPIEATIVKQTGEVVDVNTKMVAPGEYHFVFPTEPGMYFLNVRQTAGNGSNNVYNTGFTVPYSDEYLLNGVNRGFLEELRGISGGVEVKKASEAFRPLKEKPYKRQEFSEWLLLLAFVLLVVEIVIRRFGLSYVILFFEKLRDKRASNREEQESVAASKIKRLSSKKKPQLQPEINVQTKIKPKSEPPRATERPPRETVKNGVDREERMKRLLNAKKRKS